MESMTGLGVIGRSVNGRWPLCIRFCCGTPLLSSLNSICVRPIFFNFNSSHSLLYTTSSPPLPHCSPSHERGIVSASSWSNGNLSEVSHDKILQVVLFSPQIPGNTGCIARTCAASAVGLHLVKPLGFQIDDTKLKRAGLDYWPVTMFMPRMQFYNSGFATCLLDSTYYIRYVVVKVHDSWAEFKDYFRQQAGHKRLLAFTKRGVAIHSDFSYKRGDWLVFGSETCGLPPDVLSDCSTESLGGGTIRIPMVETYVRCLNLSVSVGIALYEASRQLNYEQIQFQPEPSPADSNAFVSEDIFC